MYQNKQLNKEQYDILKKGFESDQIQSETATKALVKQQAKEVVEAQAKDDVKISTKGKLQFESADKDFKFRFGGRLQLDGAVYNSDRSDFGSQAEVRRARLYASGTLWRSWDFKSQFDFSGGKVGIRDLYIKYTGWGPHTVTVGHFKEPFSLEGMTSSRYVTFLERGLPDVLTPIRSLGLGFNTYGNNWTLGLGLFANGFDDEEDNGIDESYGISGRATFAPILEDNKLLHFGAGLAHREVDNGETLRLRQRPEAHTADYYLLNTGNIGRVDSFNRFGGEMAVVYGPASLQGQYIYMDVDRSGAEDLGFGGYYVEASWFLTGEQRKYNRKKGLFSYPELNTIAGMGGIGAWQLAARFSSLDLNDGVIKGGEEENFTVGLNWYSTPNIRFAFNYTKVLDLYRPGSIHHNDEPSIFQLRAQAHW